jgi:hypothetical protein
MTIECYYSACPNHEVHDGTPDCGPFCNQPECTATIEQLAVFKADRDLKMSAARMLQHSRDLQDMRDKLSADVGELLAIFEHDTGMTIAGAHIRREPSVIGQEHGKIHTVDIEVLL